MAQMWCRVLGGLLRVVRSSRIMGERQSSSNSGFRIPDCAARSYHGRVDGWARQRPAECGAGAGHRRLVRVTLVAEGCELELGRDGEAEAVQQEADAIRGYC
jgi:hypothetical protein